MISIITNITLTLAISGLIYSLYQLFRSESRDARLVISERNGIVYFEMSNPMRDFTLTIKELEDIMTAIEKKNQSK